MGNSNSVTEAKSEEEPPSIPRDVEESKTLIEDLSEETKEEEEEECILYRYIKGGECKEAFIELEKCVDHTEEENKCNEVRIKFKTCMYDNPLYYEPVLLAEAGVIAKALSELQAEKEAILAGEATAIAKALSKLQTEEVPILPAQAAAIAKEFRKLEDEKEVVEEAKEYKGNQ